MSEQSHPSVAPMLSYMDADKALEWLPAAFGCTVTNKIVMDDGRVGHAELGFGDGVVMIAEIAPPYESPDRLAAHYPPAAEWFAVPYIINGVWAEVDDVDAHFAQAKAHGATILSEPVDQGHGKSYRVADLEGHRWMFSQR